jgi:two-component system, OmpR family, sensor histidine kinase MprB
VSEGAPPSHRTLSLRGRVALLVAAAVAVAVAATSVAAFVVVSSQVQNQFDQDLLGRARAAVGGALGNPRTLLLVDPTTLGAVEVELLPPEGPPFLPSGGQRPPDSVVELTVARTQDTYSIRTATQDGQTMRVVAVPAGGFALVLAQSTESTDHTLRELTLVLLLVGGVGVVLAAMIGLVIARAGLRPVDELTAAAEHIARTEQLTPIPVHGDDELARLTAAFNSMLTSLDSSRSRQKQLVADAGHELRTPLTSLRTNLDLLIQNDQTAPDAQLPTEDRSALLGDVRAQIEELSSLVGDLVELSRDDGPSTTSGAAIVETVDLAEVVDRAVERVRRRAPRVHFDVLTQPWELVGQPAALERAVTNLLDNAAKWSPEAGTVWVRLTGGTLTVADQGPGISDEDLPHIFERFYRSLEARALPGSGLGLAIVDQTVRRHGGQVHAARGPVGGTVITVTLPGGAALS